MTFKEAAEWMRIPTGMLALSMVGRKVRFIVVGGEVRISLREVVALEDSLS